MGLAETHPSVEKERVVIARRRCRDRLAGRVGKLVGGTNDEGFKSITWIQAVGPGTGWRRLRRRHVLRGVGRLSGRLRLANLRGLGGFAVLKRAIDLKAEGDITAQQVLQRGGDIRNKVVLDPIAEKFIGYRHVEDVFVEAKRLDALPGVEMGLTKPIFQ